MDRTRQIPPFTCGLCDEESTALARYYAGDSLVCEDCARDYLVPKFLDALHFQYRYPAEWSPGVRLDPAEYANLLPIAFIEEMQQRSIEYGTPGEERI